MVRYKYDTVEDFIADRSFNTHLALKDTTDNDLLFGQILRNAMKHAFECGVVNQGGVEPAEDYE